MPEPDYSIKQVAAKFGVTYQTVHRMIKLGYLEAYRVGLGKRRAIRVTAQSVNTYIQRNKVQPAGEENEDESEQEVAQEIAA